MTEEPTRVQILHEGAALTSGDRDKQYGPPVLNLTLAGELKQVFRNRMTRTLSPGEMEAIDMVLTKISRIGTGTFKRDNYVDGATYVAIAGEVAEMYDIQQRRQQAEIDAEKARQDSLTRPLAEALGGEPTPNLER